MRQTHRRWDHDEQKGVLISPHVSFLQSSISVTLCVNTPHTFGCSCDNMFNTHKLALYLRAGHSFIHENIFITLVISTGRPDLAAVIMGSSPLACLRCCAAPVMSYKQPNSSRCINQTTSTQQLFKTPMTQQASAKIQRRQGNYLSIKEKTEKNKSK